MLPFEFGSQMCRYFICSLAKLKLSMEVAMRLKTGLAGCIAGALVLFSLSAQALINPNFTPLNLVSDSERIAVVSIKKTDKEGVCSMEVVEVLKGDKEKGKKAMVLDFTKSLNADTKKFLLEHVFKPENTTALFFVGKFNDKDAPGAAGGEGAEAAETKAFIHIGAKWIDILSGADANTWETLQVSSHMEATWAGGSDMLLRAVRYTLSDTTADFPVKSGARWEDPVQVGKVDDIVRLRPVDLAGNGKWSIFATSAKGDKLFSFDKAAKKLAEVTAAKKLTSKSIAACWGDFNGDGKLDLASFDGKAVTVFAQQADGTFKSQAVALAADALATCKALATVDVGQKDKLGLLISGGAAPVIVRDLLGKEPKAEALAEGTLDSAPLGKAGESLVADFDGDAIADVMCLFEKGSLLYKGKGGGVFAPAAKCAVALGIGANPACVADFDADGKLDVFTVAEDGERVWQNEGNGKFVDYLNISGEIAYISKQNGVDCFLCDVNNDGRQDAMITYSGEPGLHVFFNRGFRSFGHAHDLDIQENRLLEQGVAGAKTGCIADFNDDGAQDMLAALPNGEVWILYRSIEDGQTLSAVAALPLSSTYKGPVKVIGWGGERNERCLGAWNVIPGVTDAFFGTRDAGKIKIKWQIPGGAEQSADIMVESKPKRIDLK